ncbi:MAG: metallophosphoesterase [Clostridia bacterium]|nr:metallophosphoesterase [Clostridia bacterium]
MSNMEENKRPEHSKPLFFVSDFHGVYDAMDIVKSKVENGNSRVVILGDCMDRGNEGIRILSEIKTMSEEGKDIMYIPGNHDEAIYTKFRNFVEMYRIKRERNEITNELMEELQLALRSTINAARFDGFAKGNGQLPTLEEIKKKCETIEGVKDFFETLIWLEEQPLLRIEVDCDGRKIAMGHAAFDMELFSMDEPLTLKSKTFIDKRYDELKKSAPNSKEFEDIKKMNKKAFACLWYRNPNDMYSFDFDRVVTLPNETEADVIVVGHTPKQMEVSIIGENITRNAIDVDGGTVECYLSGNGEMLKFEPYRESIPTKVMVPSFVIVGRKGAYEKLDLMDEYRDDFADSEQSEQEDDDVKVYIPKKRKKYIDTSDPDEDFGDI